MAYYEYFVYASRRVYLEEIRETLVNLWEFDPGSVSIRRSWKSWDHRIATALFNLFGIRQRGDWLMTITGPEIYRDRVHTVAEAWEGFCNGGGYDFGYDPYQHYSDEQVYRHTEAWEKKNAEIEAKYLASLPAEEQERIRVAMQDLMSHIREHEDDEG
jgi:DNA-directed RNA polymerase specialized sigma24 family protein